MDAFSAVAPPDKVDRTPIDEALKALLGAIASIHNPKPSVTLTLGEAEWARARTYYQRPYQRKPTSEFGVYLAEGTVWFQRQPDDSAIVAENLAAAINAPPLALDAGVADGMIRTVPGCAHCPGPIVWVRAYGGWVCSGCAPEEPREAARRLLSSPPHAVPSWRATITGIAPDATPAPVDQAQVTERALDTATTTMGASTSVTSTARDSGAVYGGPWVAPEDR